MTDVPHKLQEYNTYVVYGPVDHPVVLDPSLSQVERIAQCKRYDGIVVIGRTELQAIQSYQKLRGIIDRAHRHI